MPDDVASVASPLSPGPGSTEPTGTGPGALTPDGCSVEVYKRLPPDGDPERAHAVAGPGAAVLDLGCGVGRVADPLVRLGHRVVAVDESPEMLAQVRAAEPVLARIQGLDLGRRFDLVLLASHLANVPGRAARAELFGTCRRHLVDGGTLLFEWSTPDWFDHLVEVGRLSGRLDPLGIEVQVHGVDRPEQRLVVDATVTYRDGDLAWTQRFRTERLTVDDLAAELAEHDLGRPTPLDDAPHWLVARTREASR
jgi:SAM-dependent methyltransferase